MGELHLDIIVDRMRREFDVECNVGAPQVAYREAITTMVEHPTVTVKCRTAIKVLFLYMNLCQSVKLDSLSCPFTSTSFLII
jgi:hypothetical protein